MFFLELSCFFYVPNWISDAIQPSHPLSSPSPAFNLSQNQVFSNESVLHIRWPQYWASLIAQLVKNPPAMQKTLVQCNAEDPGSIPGSGRSPGEGIGYPLQYSWASLVAELVKNPPAMRETWVGKIPWRRESLPTPVFWPGEFHGLHSP